MKKSRVGALVAAILVFTGAETAAAEGDFSTGPLIKDYGPKAIVPGAQALPTNTRFQVAFDVIDRAGEGQTNRKFESAARFLNMHAAVGVKPENMKLAVVIHGPSVLDVTNTERFGGANPNADMIAELQKHGVRFIVCGQSATYQDVSVDDLLPGVEMAVSAMTAHALLQQGGYTLNPF